MRALPIVAAEADHGRTFRHYRTARCLLIRLFWSPTRGTLINDYYTHDFENCELCANAGAMEYTKLIRELREEERQREEQKKREAEQARLADRVNHSVLIASICHFPPLNDGSEPNFSRSFAIIPEIAVRIVVSWSGEALRCSYQNIHIGPRSSWKQFM